MKKSRRKFDASFKARVAIGALKERETLSQLALKYELHPSPISQWKQEFLDNSSIVFESKTSEKDNDIDVSKLYHKIGELEQRSYRL